DAIARLMLDYVVDVNSRDKAGSTPLLEAVRQGKSELVKDLVKRGADLHARTEDMGGGRGGGGARFGGGAGLTPFLVAAQTGNIQVMKDLMALGADPKEKTPEGAGALFFATSSRRLDAVKMLVELGLDVNEAPKGRGSALHSAIRLGAN